MTSREGGKRWKSTDTKRMNMLTNVYTITCEVAANASKNYIHRENE
jgi:hypothetical protein